MVDRVHHVVEGRGKGVEILAIERRDERAMQALDGVVRERVAPMLGVPDAFDLAFIRWCGGQHLLQECGRRADFVGDLPEQIKELLIAGQQAESERHRVGEILAKKV